MSSSANATAFAESTISAVQAALHKYQIQIHELQVWYPFHRKSVFYNLWINSYFHQKRNHSFQPKNKFILFFIKKWHTRNLSFFLLNSYILGKTAEYPWAVNKLQEARRDGRSERRLSREQGPRSTRYYYFNLFIFFYLACCPTIGQRRPFPLNPSVHCFSRIELSLWSCASVLTIHTNIVNSKVALSYLFICNLFTTKRRSPIFFLF